MPHAQAPLRQFDAVSGLQVPHAMPPLPHVASDWVALITHVPFWQQPPGQEPGSQPTQVRPVEQPLGQFWQAAPPAPHSLAVVPATHAPLALQQPPSHEVASHRQVPFTQRWPVMQAEPPPQEHAP